jgi:hypothetical protein
MPEGGDGIPTSEQRLLGRAPTIAESATHTETSGNRQPEPGTAGKPPDAA